MPDIHEPLPDRAHEMLRQTLVAAIDDLEEQVERINDAFLMLSVTTDMAQAVQNTTISASSGMANIKNTAGGLAQQVAALNTRLNAAAIRENTAQSCIDVLQDQLADALARIEKLEQPQAPEEA